MARERSVTPVDYVCHMHSGFFSSRGVDRGTAILIKIEIETDYAKLTRKLSKSNMNTNGSGQIAGRNAPNSPLP